MEKIQITAKVPGDKKKGESDKVATVNVPFATSAAEAIKVYGGEAVLSNAKANAVVSLQGLIRGRIKQGKTAKEIEAEFADYKMGVSMRRSADPIAATMKKAETMDKDQLNDLIAALKAKAAAPAA